MTASDKRHLLAAQGWIELGLFADAVDELDSITPKNRKNPDVLAVRWGANSGAKKWEEAVELAQTLTEIAPDRFDGWWMKSYALHEMKRTQEAYENLASVIPKFSREHTAHYNVACYLVQLGRVDDAREYLKVAFALAPDMREGALADPDLESLWPEIRRGAFSSTTKPNH
jgi:tetratricopeptide (TPR) repeat protein